MSEYKYPYIPKEYYPAVMCACALIRKYGTFNTAVRTAASRYGVDEEEIAKHVRKRQGAGQKGQTRKYQWYLVVGYRDCWIHDYDVDLLESQYDPDGWEKNKQKVAIIIKATSEKNAKNQIPLGHVGYDQRLHGIHLSDYKMTVYPTEQEAKNALEKLRVKHSVSCMKVSEM